MVGVMDGAASDLCQGLPWQGVEIHEPVRILFVIETTPGVMKRIMENDPWVARIFKNNWAQLAVLDPDSAGLRVFEKGEFELYHASGKALPRVKESAEWYTGQRDHLGFAEITCGIADW
ncbi:DUF2309 family protein [bacterium]|nr:DUF2309 family protein [bacterium]